MKICRIIRETKEYFDPWHLGVYRRIIVYRKCLFRKKVPLFTYILKEEHWKRMPIKIWH